MTKIPNNVIKPPPGYEYVTTPSNTSIHRLKLNRVNEQDDIKKRIDAEKKLKETIENGTIAQTDQLIALKEEELQRENLRSAHGRDRISRDKNIAKLEQEIEALEKRKKSMSELNDIMEKNKTYNNTVRERY